MNTALAGGMLAIGLARAGRDGEALRQFKLSMPILVAASREIDSDDATEAAAHEQRAQIVIEAYIALLARMERAPGDADTAAETFRLADVIRSHSVQKAITASSARAVAEKPSLSELARKAQDLEKQVVAQLGVLNDALTLSPISATTRCSKRCRPISTSCARHVMPPNAILRAASASMRASSSRSHPRRRRFAPC